jgi:hypothetical protein
MKKQFKNFAILAIALCFSCTSSDDTTPEGIGGGESIQARYKVSFEPNFTNQFHPTDYPNGAVFVKPIFIVHSNTTSLFTEGSVASNGLEQYVEDGDSSGVVLEHTQSQDNVNPTTILLGTSDVGPTEVKEYTITFAPDKTMFSFVTRISPSPDWFLGVDSFSILNADNSLKEGASFKLYAFDAGTKAGETYNANDGDETVGIALRTGLPLSSLPDETGKFLGILSLERLTAN